jgi:hypothetical protein
MYNFLTKNGQTVALGLGILAIAIFLGSVFSGISADPAIDLSTDLNKYDGKSDISFFNPGLAVTIGMIAIAALLAIVVFGIINLLKFPKGAIKFGIGLVVLAVIFGGLYATSNAETVGKLGELHEKFSITENVSKFISGGLKTTVGLALAAFGAMVVLEVVNLFK